MMASNQPNMKHTALPPGKEGRFKYSNGQYRDKFWYFLFVVHLAGMIAVGAKYGGAFISEMEIEGGSGWSAQNPKSVIFVLFVAAITGVSFGWSWLKLMKRVRLKTLVYMYFLMMGAGVLVLFFLNFIAAVIAGLCFAITLVWFFCCAQQNVPFAEAIMRASSQSLQDHNGAILLVFFLAAVQLAWVISWTFIAGSLFYHLNPDGVDTNNQHNFLMFILLVSLYWTAEVIKNVGHVTTAGTVASWWFLPASPSPTCSSFKRAVTTSFGSICFGSLIVAILKAARAMIRSAKENARRSDNMATCVVLALADCCLGCIESLVEYFNMYAYTHVAIYGEDFITAAKSTMSLFRANGFTALINDNIIGMVLGLGIFLGLVSSACVSGLVAYVVVKAWTIPLLIIGAIIGMIMTALIMNAMTSAVATTFVCWAEDPAAMQNGRPNYFKTISDAANQRYGQDWRQNAGNQRYGRQSS